MASKKKTIKDVISGTENLVKGIQEVQEDRFALKRMAEKVREIVGDKYVFVLFDINYPPETGDEIKVGELTAIFRRKKL